MFGKEEKEEGYNDIEVAVPAPPTPVTAVPGIRLDRGCIELAPTKTVTDDDDEETFVADVAGVFVADVVADVLVVVVGVGVGVAV